MRSEGYSNRSVTVCLSDCLFVGDFSRTTGYEAAHERYQQLQCYKGKKIKGGDFARYGVKTSEKANMHNEHWLTSTAFSPFGEPWTNKVTKGICIQVQRCSEPTHDHVAS